SQLISATSNASGCDLPEGAGIGEVRITERPRMRCVARRTRLLTSSSMTAEARSQREVLLAFSAMMLATLLAALDQTIVATALPQIVTDLHGFRDLSWVVSSFLVAAT